jgi:DNA-binding CsgD family transcriptional regulator
MVALASCSSCQRSSLVRAGAASGPPRGGCVKSRALAALKAIGPMQETVVGSAEVLGDPCALMEGSFVAAGRHGALRGRRHECGVLDGLLADVRRGQSRSLVLRGEAGIGKSALLQYLMGSATGMTVLPAVGVESEMELAYASLHQLCVPLLDRLEGLPAPQREAVRVVFGMAELAPPDRFLVGLGVLSLLSAVAEEHPVLCVVDDAHWLDQASAVTLAFVARRLGAERIGIVFAAREPAGELRQVSELDVRGLRNGDARALLESVVRFSLDERVQQRIVRETRGNPLALLELPRGLTATQLMVGFGLADAHALPGRIEESFLRRLEALPAGGRRLLLLAAAEPLGDPILLWRAAGRLGIDPRAADHIASEGLLAIEERVIFRHPLVRSAVYRSAAVEDRRAVHLALAEATDREADPDRRAWHLAAATTVPDEEVAAELERSAARAQSRGGVAAAAAFLQRSVALTLDPVRRSDRCIAAAQAQQQAGAFDEALRLLASVDGASLDALGRARVELLRGQIAFASTAGGDAPAQLVRAARAFESLDPALARETYLDAWGAALFAGVEAMVEVSQAALAVPRPSTDPRPSDLLLDALARLVMRGSASAAQELTSAVSLFAEGEVDIATGLRWGWLASYSAPALWDEDSWYAVNVRQLQSVREAGLLAQLPAYLHGLGTVLTWRGDFATARSVIAEADAVADATGTRFARYAAVFLAGMRGDEAQASTLIDVELRNATATGRDGATRWCEWVAAVLYNGLGRYDQAVAESQRASDAGLNVFLAAWALPELIEAATRRGDAEVAVEALGRLDEATDVGETNWGLGLLARSRALLSEGAHAEAGYREALDRLGRTRLRPEVARAHLLYGEWLRRENRRLDAREELRIAYEEFVAIGMEAFAERARTELQATGQHLRPHTVEARDDLTPQERQIGELARDGLSNAEIGARLFLSPRTVEWHLHHVFVKLGIKSRRDLARALPESIAS